MKDEINALLITLGLWIIIGIGLYVIHTYPQQTSICLLGGIIMIALICSYAVIRNIIKEERHIPY